MYNNFDLKNKNIQFVNNSENALNHFFLELNKIYEHNQLKVLNAFIDSKISETHFQESTGYGYNDIGRDKIEEVYSKVFNTEDALVRQQFVSGTHAISLSIFALTRPGDNILSINGLPYDTLSSTLGLNNEPSSIKEFNISFNFVDLKNNDFDYDSIKNSIKTNTKLIMIQRSRGYSLRKALSCEQIAKVVKYIKSINDKIIILLDNCYGEFVDILEPTDCGVDIMCGSLIKNPGGGLAKSGAYIVGKKDLIEKCALRLTAPGIGKEVGVNFNQNRNILQGLYLAPQTVYNALKIVALYSYVFNKIGISTVPMHNEKYNDIVISVILNDKNKLCEFCNIIQSFSPVDSYAKPVSNEMPGYDSEVIMAAGCFVSGASIELSCDAPMREPYMAFLQGGLSYYQGKVALIKALELFDF